MALNTMTPVSNWVQFYGHHHKFVDYYEIAISQQTIQWPKEKGQTMIVSCVVVSFKISKWKFNQLAIAFPLVTL
jgi:hypothetical protein